MKMKLVNLTALIYLGAAVCQGQQCTQDDCPGVKDRSELDPDRSVNHEAHEGNDNNNNNVNIQLEVESRKENEMDDRISKKLENAKTYIDAELKNLAESLEDSVESLQTNFQKETQILSEKLSQSQDGLEQEQARPIVLQTELSELKESFSEKLNTIEANWERITRDVNEELEDDTIRSKKLQNELHGLNARFIMQFKTTKAEYDRKIREVANAGETMLQTKTNGLSKTLVQLQDELNQERSRSTELQTELQSLNARFIEQFETTKTDYDRKIREVANAGETMLQTKTNGLSKTLVQLQDELNQERSRSTELQTELQSLNARFIEQFETTKTDYDRKIREVANAGETMLQTKTNGLSKTLVQLQDEFNQERSRSTELQTELQSLNARFIEQFETTKTDYDRKIREVANAGETMLQTKTNGLSKTLVQLQDELNQERSRSTELQTELQSLNARFIEQFETTKTDYDRKIREVANAGETMLQTKTNGLSKTLVQLQDELNQERSRSTELQTELQSLNARFIEQFETTKTDYDRKIREVANAGETKLQTKTNGLSKTLVQLQDELNQERSRSTELRTELRKLNASFSEQFKTTKTEYDRKIREVAKAGESMVQIEKTLLQERLEEQQEQVNIILPNTFNKDSVSLLGIGIIIWLAVLTAVFIFYLGQGQNKIRANDGGQSVSPAVARIPLNQPLQRAICVISFDKHTQALHRKVMMEQVLHGLPGELIVQFRLVLQHEDITRLPATQLYIMFVDYSERHVIIEEPGLGLGDTRRTTVQALERLGGELVMIYMNDPASRSLPSGRRYNRDIYCVNTQPTLKTLNERGRFFSVYETLNEFQCQNMQSTIEDVFSD